MAVAETAMPTDGGGPQPKAALNYRLGGDHCHVCMYYTESVGDPETGTCSRVTPPDVSGHDVCDDFKRAGQMREQASGSEMDPTVQNLQRRGMISDRAMSKVRGGY